MVDLLANGSGIPASASRLAHAMHDVLKALDTELINYRNRIDTADKAVDTFAKRLDAATPGLNDKALAADVEACRPKNTMFDRGRYLRSSASSSWRTQFVSSKRTMPS